jgi:serine protease DegS
MPLSRTTQLLIPGLIGLSVAVLMLAAFPDLRKFKSDTRQTTELDQQNNPLWPDSGVVSYSQAVGRAAPSVVNIYTLKVSSIGNNHPLAQHPVFGAKIRRTQVPQTSLGSGVIMRGDGYILTNYHVINGAEKILGMLYDGRTAPVTLIGTDPDTDLAVLRINLDELQPIALGQPEQAKIGDVVLAIGNPHGIGQTVTQGIISATGRNGLGINTFENFLQTDAGISPGNSGGALIDVYGDLLGINTASIRSSDSISFAIPADTAQRVLDEILEHGFVIRGWLGIDAVPMTPRAARVLSIPMTNGLLIRAIAPGGPTASVDIYPGDIVTSIDGQNVVNSQTSMMQIASVKPGNPIELKILRRGKILEVTAVAGSRRDRPKL